MADAQKKQANSNNPFNPMGFDMEKAMSMFQMPALGLNAAMEMQRKNAETLRSMGELAMESLRIVARRQMEIAQEAMEKSSEAARDVMSEEDHGKRLLKHAEWAQSSYERHMSNLRELGEIAAKSNREAMDMLNSCVLENVEEVKGALKKKKA